MGLRFGITVKHVNAVGQTTEIFFLASRYDCAESH
jgi:hypothetical protein